jgi:hypothetical protein
VRRGEVVLVCPLHSTGYILFALSILQDKSLCLPNSEKP